MYSFVPPFRKAKFCGVPSRVFDKLGCAAGEKSLRNTGIEVHVHRRPWMSEVFCFSAWFPQSSVQKLKLISAVYQKINIITYLCSSKEYRLFYVPQSQI
jgi:hypothetical protein